MHIESGEEIVTHETHMEHLGDTDIASIPSGTYHFKEKTIYSGFWLPGATKQYHLTSIKVSILEWNTESFIYFRDFPIDEICYSSQEINRFEGLQIPVIFCLANSTQNNGEQR